LQNVDIVNKMSKNSYENNIYTNDGNPSNSFFSCDTSAITSGTSPTCSIIDVSVNTLPGKKY
jgi:hypothetical protein